MQQLVKRAAVAGIVVLHGCGGGSDSGLPLPGPDLAAAILAPPATAGPFALQAAMEALLRAGLRLQLRGTDDGTDGPGAQHAWRGTLNLASRAPHAGFQAAAPDCAAATRLVDLRITLTREHDGRLLQEAATFGYTDDFRPVCALLADGSFWAWRPAAPLPALSHPRAVVQGGAITGEVRRSPQAPDGDAQVAQLVGLFPERGRPDLAWLSFVYQLLDYPAGAAASQRMFGDGAELRLRIDAGGRLQGFTYVRTGVVAEGDAPVRLTVSAA